MSCDFVDRSTDYSDYCLYDDDYDDNDELTDWSRRQLHESRAPASNVIDSHRRLPCSYGKKPVIFLRISFSVIVARKQRYAHIL